MKTLKEIGADLGETIIVLFWFGVIVVVSVAAIAIIFAAPLVVIAFVVIFIAFVVAAKAAKELEDEEGRS